MTLNVMVAADEVLIPHSGLSTTPRGPEPALNTVERVGASMTPARCVSGMFSPASDKRT